MTTYTYVITDDGGDALYVGHTTDVYRRLREHARQAWGSRISRVAASVHPNKAAALRVERNLIADLDPEFNTQGRVSEADVIEALATRYLAERASA